MCGHSSDLFYRGETFAAEHKVHSMFGIHGFG